MRVEVKGEMLRWARERAQQSHDDLRKRFPKIEAWEEDALDPTLKQLEDFASAVHVPLGYLFLAEPPQEPLPIPDFRTMGNQPVAQPSPDLLDMIYACERRQDWYRDYARSEGLDPVPFVGTRDTGFPIAETANHIRAVLQFDIQARIACRTWEDALRMFVGNADAAGVLVMCSGIVMNNTHRKLNPKEFRGFALADDLAPLVFINGADSKSAQMFTLAHEIAHIWLGQSALSNSTVAATDQNAVEAWCNRVAAELLVPLADVEQQVREHETVEQAMSRLARRFKVSTLVILQRLRDVGWLNWEHFNQAYAEELARLAALPPRQPGGDFYASTGARYGKRFARALVRSTLEGRTEYGEAYRLLGISKAETFNELGRTLHFSI